MGYSCTVKADYVLDALLIQLQSAGNENNSSNTWTKDGQTYFFERGREQPDGAITGRIYRFEPDNMCKLIGNGRIDADGDIPYFPTSKQVQRDSAMTAGLIKYHELHGGSWQEDEILHGLIGDAKFVAI